MIIMTMTMMTVMTVMIMSIVMMMMMVVVIMVVVVLMMMTITQVYCRILNLNERSFDVVSVTRNAFLALFSVVCQIKF